MTEPTIYSAVYGGYDSPQEQVVPVTVLTEATHPLPMEDPRAAAKWWKVFPELAVPGAEVTIWIDGTQVVKEPGFAAEMLRLLGGNDLMLFKHEQRNCIYAEVAASRRGEKYDEMPLEAQARAYRGLQHPPGWGLAHACCIVRRDTPAVRDFDARWWHEIETWSLQDQISLSPVLRASPRLKWRWAPAPVGHWLRQVRHAGPDVWRPRR